MISSIGGLLPSLLPFSISAVASRFFLVRLWPKYPRKPRTPAPTIAEMTKTTTSIVVNLFCRKAAFARCTSMIPGPRIGGKIGRGGRIGPGGRIIGGIGKIPGRMIGGRINGGGNGRGRGRMGIPGTIGNGGPIRPPIKGPIGTGNGRMGTGPKTPRGGKGANPLGGGMNGGGGKGVKPLAGGMNGTGGIGTNGVNKGTGPGGGGLSPHRPASLKRSLQNTSKEGPKLVAQSSDGMDVISKNLPSSPSVFICGPFAWTPN